MVRIIIQLALCANLLLPAVAFAADAIKDPFSYSLKQYGLFLGVAVLGGIVSFLAKLRGGEASKWNITQFVGELTTSAFAGLLCFWGCELFSSPQLLTALLVGISGHMGTRAIQAFEEAAKRRFDAATEQVSSFLMPLGKK